jgi:serine/threonine protein kinase
MGIWDLHKHKILNYNIKPQNVLLNKFNLFSFHRRFMFSENEIKIANFGIFQTTSGTLSNTTTNSMSGSTSVEGSTFDCILDSS